MVAPVLPPGSALVEIVRADIFNFKATRNAPRWKPAHYFAFVLRGAGDAEPVMIDLGLADDIDQAVGAVRDRMEEATRAFGRAPGATIQRPEEAREEEFRQASADLYRKAFAPVRKALGHATLVYVAPDGELNRVAFESLVEENGKYLIESYRFAYLSSGRDLLRTAPAPATGTTAFAGPDYDLGVSGRQTQARLLLAALPHEPQAAIRGQTSREVRSLKWEPLPGAAAELADLQQELAGSRYGPVTGYTGAQALEEVFKSLPAPRVLHVATHGFFLSDQEIPLEDRTAPMELGTGFGAARGLARLRGTENPLLRSGIVLAGVNALGEAWPEAAEVDDGWVTAQEIAMMDLRGTELVVLSACESGLGDVKCGEGVYGLRRAFLYAGARTLLTSLYKVPDEQTRDLMHRFYGSLKEGKSKLDALHEVQLAIIRQRRAQNGAAHPFFWASFVLVGDPA